MLGLVCVGFILSPRLPLTHSGFDRTGPLETSPLTVGSGLPALLQNFAVFVGYCLKMSCPYRPEGVTLFKYWEMGALLSEMRSHVMPSPFSGADSDELAECAGERCLIIESRLHSDVDQRHTGLAHQSFGVVNAMLNQPLVGGGAERGFE